MTLDPVPAALRVPSVRAPRPLTLHRHPEDTASTLRLVLGLGAQGELLGRSEHGEIYRFGDGSPLPHWHAGQTLLVRVLRAGPPLEIQVLGAGVPDATRASPDAAAHAEPPALRPDQAGILRLAAASNDTMALAAHWRQLALQALRPAATLHPAPAGTPAVAERPGAAAPDPALWLRLLPWHNWPLTLWVEQRRRIGGAERRARRRPGTRLCLAIALDPWGRIALVLDVLDTRVGLTLLAVQDDAVASLRAQAGAITARLSRAGLQLMRCEVRHAPDFAAPRQAAPTAANAMPDHHELSLALFRAGSEALEALRRASAALAP